ncbi:hypothetical protein [Streptomyces fagopyri]|uniref:hypothetical protein n=1 Tax=Streptomyces fagopyri TaxID=2662397 RepID=UPI0033E4C9E6
MVRLQRGAVTSEIVSVHAFWSTTSATSPTRCETGTDSYRLASTRARAEEPAKAG